MRDQSKKKQVLIQELLSLRERIVELEQSESERKKADDALRETEERYRALAFSADSMYLVDRECRYLFMNDAHLLRLGVSLDQVKGRSYGDFHSEEDMKQFAATIEAVFETGNSFQTEHKGRIDDSFFLRTFNPVKNSQGSITAVTVISKDITERKKTEEALRESEERYRYLVKHAPTGIYEVDFTTRKFLSVNDAMCQYTGYTREEFLSMDPIQLLTEESQKSLIQRHAKVLAGEPVPDNIEYQIRRKNGSEFWVILNNRYSYEPNNRILSTGIVHDITESKRAEEVLRQSEEKYRDIFDKTLEGIYRTTPAGRFVILNPAFARICGYASPEEMMEKVTDIANQLYANPEDRLRFQKLIAAEGEVKGFDVQFKYPTKGLVWISINSKALRDEQGNIQYYDGTIEDITERKQAEDALRRSEENFRRSMDDSPLGVRIVTVEGETIYANRAILDFCGYDNIEELKTNPVLERYTPESFAEYQIRREERKRGNYYPSEYDISIVRKDGEVRHLHVFRKEVLWDGERQFQVLYNDITERKRAEEALKESEEKYRSIVENTQEGIYQTTPEGRFITVNRAMSDMLGYDSPEELIASLTDIDHQLYVNPEDRTKLRGMVGEHGSVKGFETQFYRKYGSWIWVSINIRAVHDTNGRVLYYEGINEDISIRKQAEDERERSFERLRRVLRATIQAIAMTVETRDPYTAGHQRRVSDLARAIATEMGLSRERIDGIRMAGTIHDLGKISVPAEILSKPSELTNLEFGIVKTHAQSGYDILKDVEFPWPIARMVLEHHERMDGSGYPNGLTGENLLVESRILAVADVVESMASHRPYRPAFGIDAALEEIENNRGTHYDTSAVDACLRLFRENGYQLKGT